MKLEMIVKTESKSIYQYNGMHVIIDQYWKSKDRPNYYVKSIHEFIGVNFGIENEAQKFSTIDEAQIFIEKQIDKDYQENMKIETLTITVERIGKRLETTFEPGIDLKLAREIISELNYI